MNVRGRVASLPVVVSQTTATPSRDVDTISLTLLVEVDPADAAVMKRLDVEWAAIDSVSSNVHISISPSSRPSGYELP